VVDDAAATRRDLRNDLLSAIFAAVPAGRLDSCAALWRAPPEPSYPAAPAEPSYPAAPAAAAATVAADGAGAGAEGRAAAAAAAAREALLDVVAHALYGAAAPPTSPPFGAPAAAAEAVAALAAPASRTSAALGQLLLLGPPEARALLAALYSDVDRKLASALLRAKDDFRTTGGGAAGAGAGAVLDEGLVTKLVAKGFSRNGAKRSVLATRGESLEAAFRWAVEHSLDRDFEDPVVRPYPVPVLSGPYLGPYLGPCHSIAPPCGIWTASRRSSHPR